jgi:glycosyltransferase involved in cell wall biosynthesis
MNLNVVSEFRFSRTPDGIAWTDSVFPFAFWQRYLDVFDQVVILARVQDVPAAQPAWQQVSGDKVAMAALPYYLGPWQYLRHFPTIKRASRSALSEGNAVIFRVVSPIAATVEPGLHQAGRPYALEVVGDPYDVFGPGAVRHPLRPFFRWWFSRQLRIQCRRACAVAYVTQHALQRRYPPAANAFSTYYSSVELPESAFAAAPRPPAPIGRPAHIVFVGMLEQMYKAPDILLEALALCLNGGLDFRLAMLGDGKYRPLVEALAARLGLGSRVQFLGMLAGGDPVRAELDRADLFVLPSRTEGLPRAMIEAMARGLPCIGSSAGGILELLPPQDCVPPGDAAALARKIQEVAADPERMAAMSARNLKRAREYHQDILRQRRVIFYRAVREKTEAWLRDRL